MVSPVQKTREFFFLHPIMEKNLSQVFKNHFPFARNTFRKKKLVKLAKIVVLSFWGRAVLER
jgi:hypothetical protein